MSDTGIDAGYIGKAGIDLTLNVVKRGRAHMYNHILIATDGSEFAQRGIDHGLGLAKALGARVTIAIATAPFFVPSAAGAEGWVPSDAERANFEASQKTFAEGVLKSVKDTASKMGVTADTIHVADALPATAIVETAQSAGCSLIVMASHGRRGLRRLLLGSQASEVLAHSTVPVLVVR